MRQGLAVLVGLAGGNWHHCLSARMSQGVARQQRLVAVDWFCVVVVVMAFRIDWSVGRLFLLCCLSMLVRRVLNQLRVG